MYGLKLFKLPKRIKYSEFRTDLVHRMSFPFRTIEIAYYYELEYYLNEVECGLQRIVRFSHAKIQNILQKRNCDFLLNKANHFRINIVHHLLLGNWLYDPLLASNKYFYSIVSFHLSLYKHQRKMYKKMSLISLLATNKNKNNQNEMNELLYIGIGNEFKQLLAHQTSDYYSK